MFRQSFPASIRVAAAIPTIAVITSGGCRVLDTEQPGALVPATAEQDALLPRLRVRVAGHDRTLHLQTFGDSTKPPLFVLPGGPSADFRLLLPLRALADRYLVIMWDPRGAGLSERVAPAELTRDSFAEEIAAVRSSLGPGRQIALIGHSNGGLFALRYASLHPADVAFLALIEPGPITAEARHHYEGGFPDFTAVEDFLWQNELLTSSDHAAADYKAITLVPRASAGFTCDGAPPPADPMWRFGALHHHVLTHGRAATAHDSSWAAGLESYHGALLVVAGSCGDAGAAFQRAYNLRALPRADMKVIRGAGHLTLFLDFAGATLDALRESLPAYRAPGRSR